MARYIDAEELEKVFKDGVRVYFGRCDVDDIIRNIADQPTADVVEAVRCKDCVQWWSPMEDDAHYCRLKKGLGGLVAEEDYCSFGERKFQKDGDAE